jgi:cell division protein FtsI (penicillin-binding protein 3)
MIAFHPANERRVISTFTAGEMRQMMQRVVLHGTGKKALLIGYSSAGKTGTAQKVDPATHAYSHTKYVASFAGFAPVNNPAVTIAVVLDSAVGLHQGGQVSAPVFTRIAQQVLEYLHTPHDLEIPANRQVWLAQAKASDKDLEEGSPDHPGEAIDAAESPSNDAIAPELSEKRPAVVVQAGNRDDHVATASHIVPASLREPSRSASFSQATTVANSRPLTSVEVPVPANGTVVLDVEQGGISVPSFMGKSVRSAIEIAELSGLDLEIVGSGVAQEQSPPPGAHVASGAKITVKFGR